MERFHVGIDVSAKTLDVAYRDGKRMVQRQQFANDSAAHAALIRDLKKRAAGAVVRVVLESTGVYGLDLAFALDRAGLEPMVANPRASANFAKATMQRSKTDRLDCVMLLEFAEQMQFQRWQAPSAVQLQMRTISRRVHVLVATIRDEKNRMHAADQVEGTEVVKRSIRATIKALETQVRQLRASLLELIESDVQLARRYELLLSVKGIGQISAMAILSELAVLPSDMTDRQWVAHSGLDPREFESGTSIRMPSRISKRGNKYLRAALYLPARVACRFEPGVAAFAACLRQRGKRPLQIHVAVMRKLLHSIHAMFRNDL
ncbi:MAG: IS110 family transposase [Hyphomicrobiaceae bacterium]|nr:IS110 family transposase [Hyphomicrobiaceae bacterium]